MPDPSAFAPVTDALGAHAGKLLALSGAGGLLGGYLSSQEKGNPHETPADRRKRILKNALGYALATGGIGATGLGAASLLSSTEGTEGGVSPWKNMLGRLAVGTPVAAMYKSLVTDRLVRPKNDGVLAKALDQLGNPISKTPPAAGVAPSPMSPAELRGMTTKGVGDLINNHPTKKVFTPAELRQLHGWLRDGGIGTGHTSQQALSNAVAGQPLPTWGSKARVAGHALNRNKMPLGIGALTAFAPQVADFAGSVLGLTAKD